jgi:hypothetical protein
MPFKNLNETYRAEFLAHVRPEMLALSERKENVTWQEYEDLRANSYERKLLHRNLDADALCRLWAHCDEQIRTLGEYEIPHGYGDMISRELAPLLAKRLREVTEEREGEVAHYKMALELATRTALEHEHTIEHPEHRFGGVGGG